MDVVELKICYKLNPFFLLHHDYWRSWRFYVKFFFISRLRPPNTQRHQLCIIIMWPDETEEKSGTTKTLNHSWRIQDLLFKCFDTTKSSEYTKNVLVSAKSALSADVLCILHELKMWTKGSRWLHNFFVFSRAPKWIHFYTFCRRGNVQIKSSIDSRHPERVFLHQFNSYTSLYELNRLLHNTFV